MCDKNLGLAVMERETYIKHVLEQHLKDKNETYRQLTEREVSSRIAVIWMRMGWIVSGKLPTEECEYFSNKLLQTEDFRTPQFYGMLTVQKEVVPVPLYLIVSQYGNILAVASTFIDHKLQTLTKLV